MHRFHIIEDGAAILCLKGIFRQAKVYQRDGELYAGHGNGFVRLYRSGTSLPNMRVIDVETPGWRQSYDAFGKLSVHQ